MNEKIEIANLDNDNFNTSNLDQNYIMTMKKQQMSNFLQFYDLDLSLDDCKSYLKTLLKIEKWNNIAAEATPYELLFTIDHLYGYDEEIKSLLDKIKSIIANIYIIKQKKIIKYDRMPD